MQFLATCGGEKLHFKDDISAKGGNIIFKMCFGDLSKGEL